MFKNIVKFSAIYLSTVTLAFAGFYAGGSLSYFNVYVGNVRNESVMPSFAGGYDTRLPLWDQSIYAAAEIFAGPANIQIHNQEHEGDSLKSDYHYGFSFLPGMYLDATTLGYLRLGIIETHFKNLSNKTATGYQAGVGVELPLWPNWNVRGEFDYTQYEERSGVKPLATQFLLGLVYRFCW